MIIYLLMILIWYIARMTIAAIIFFCVGALFTWIWSSIVPSIFDYHDLSNPYS